jgi:GNAT superfamily N-acetyltransferase
MKLIHLLGLKQFLKRIIYSHHREIIQVIHLDNLPNIAFNNNLHVRSVEQDDLPRLEDFRKINGIGGNNPLAEFNQYLNNGCKGVLAELNGHLIGYSWWGNSHSSFDFDRMGFMFYVNNIDLTPSDAYGFDFFIAPQYRGKGNALEFIIKFLLSLKPLGYKRLYGFVDKDNLAARWIYQIMGYKTIKQISTLRLFIVFVFKNFTFYIDRNGFNWLINAVDPHQPGIVGQSQ